MFLFFIFIITNISYTSSIKQIHQKKKTDDLQNFEKYLKPPDAKSNEQVIDNQKLVQCKICEKCLNLSLIMINY